MLSSISKRLILSFKTVAQGHSKLLRRSYSSLSTIQATPIISTPGNLAIPTIEFLDAAFVNEDATVLSEEHFRRLWGPLVRQEYTNYRFMTGVDLLHMLSATVRLTPIYALLRDTTLPGGERCFAGQTIRAAGTAFFARNTNTLVTANHCVAKWIAFEGGKVQSAVSEELADARLVSDVIDFGKATKYGKARIGHRIPKRDIALLYYTPDENHSVQMNNGLELAVLKDEEIEVVDGIVCYGYRIQYKNVTDGAGNEISEAVLTNHFGEINIGSFSALTRDGMEKIGLKEEFVKIETSERGRWMTFYNALLGGHNGCPVVVRGTEVVGVLSRDVKKPKEDDESEVEYPYSNQASLFVEGDEIFDKLK